MNEPLVCDTVVDRILVPPTKAAADPIDTIVDQAVVPAGEAGANPALSRDDLLQPDNPAEGLLSNEDWLIIGQELRLSVRERTVAQLIFEGKTRFQIARRLHCAEGTIRVYIDRVFAKLNTADRLGMAVRVLRVARDSCPPRCLRKLRLARRLSQRMITVGS